MSVKRNVSEVVKKQVAASQKWKCSSCQELLQSTYQIDHTTELADGGSNDKSNLTAMCCNCHAKKTQEMYIKRVLEARKKAREETISELDASREDVCVKDRPGFQMCDRCKQIRPITEKWETHVCRKSRRVELHQFAFIPTRFKAKRRKNAFDILMSKKTQDLYT
jgi:hypothetical protein